MRSPTATHNTARYPAYHIISKTSHCDKKDEDSILCILATSVKSEILVGAERTVSGKVTPLPAPRAHVMLCERTWQLLDAPAAYPFRLVLFVL